MRKHTSRRIVVAIGLGGLTMAACESTVFSPGAGEATTIVSSVSVGDGMAVRTLHVAGGSPALNSIALTEVIGLRERFVPGSLVTPIGAVQYSHDGGETFDSHDQLPVTHLRWFVEFTHPSDAQTLFFRTEPLAADAR